MLNAMHVRHIISRSFSTSFRSDQIIASSSFIDRQNTWSWWLVRKCVKFITNATIMKTYKNLRWKRWWRWKKLRRLRRFLQIYATRKFAFCIVTKELLKLDMRYARISRHFVWWKSVFFCRFLSMHAMFINN